MRPATGAGAHKAGTEGTRPIPGRTAAGDTGNARGPNPSARSESEPPEGQADVRAERLAGSESVRGDSDYGDVGKRAPEIRETRAPEEQGGPAPPSPGGPVVRG